MIINVFGKTSSKVSPIRKIFHSEKDYDSETVSDTWGEPLTQKGKDIFRDEKYQKLRKMSDFELLSIMWRTGALDVLSWDLTGSKELKHALEYHFRSKSGAELIVPLTKNYWSHSPFNPRDRILQDISQAVQRAFESRSFGSFYIVDISSILDRAQLNFRTDVFNPSLTIAMGGVQECNVRTINVKEEIHSYSRGIFQPYHEHQDYRISLEIRLRDWFGVDEDDFAANNYSSIGGVLPKVLLLLVHEKHSQLFGFYNIKEDINPLFGMLFCIWILLPIM